MKQFIEVYHEKAEWHAMSIHRICVWSLFSNHEKITQKILLLYFVQLWNVYIYMYPVGTQYCLNVALMLPGNVA